MPAPPPPGTRMRDIFGSPSPEAVGSFLPLRRTSEGELKFDPSAGLLGSIIDALSLPGDVLTGKVNVHSPEAQERLLGLAFLPGGGAGAGLRSGLPPFMRVIEGGAPRTLEQAFARESSKRAVQESGTRGPRSIERVTTAGPTNKIPYSIILRNKGYNTRPSRSEDALFISDNSDNLIALVEKQPRGQYTVTGLGFSERLFNSFDKVMDFVARTLPTLKGK